MEKRKRNIITALMMAMFLGALEVTVVTTAVPTIVRSLNGFELISWVFSLYLLTSAISTPIFGKLSDLYGRKRIFSIGIAIFIFGSFLCGLAQNMYQLVIFRAIQGIGAGSIFTLTFTIAGDVFSVTERAKVQGWLGSTWGIASLVGPLLGGFLIDILTWHWIFLINIPFGIISLIMLQVNLDENFEKKKPEIDYAGCLTLSLAISLLLFAVMRGDTVEYFFSPAFLGSILGAGCLLVLFYFLEKKAIEPIFPFSIFTRTNILVNIICFFVSMTMMGIDVYIPFYIQNILGYGATISGLSVAPMSITWLISSIVLSRVIPKYGEGRITLISSLLLLGSSLLLPTLKIDSPLFLVIGYVSLIGFALGGIFTILTIVIQESVGYGQRGAAIASNSLVKTLGQTIGVSILGSIFNLSIVQYFIKLGIKGVEPGNLYAEATLKAGVTISQIKASISSGLQIIFIVFIFINLICVLISFRLPNKLKEKSIKATQ